MIRIPVFISSKMAELREDRFALASVIKSTETLEPVFAENWAPRRATPEESYIADALRCPIYVGLFWRAYSEAPNRNTGLPVPIQKPKSFCTSGMLPTRNGRSACVACWTSFIPGMSAAGTRTWTTSDSTRRSTCWRR